MYKFLKAIAGSNDGINIVNYAKDETVEENKLCEYLKENWLKSGVIEKVEENQPEDEPETQEDLIAKAKELLQAEELDADALKAIGKKLGVNKINKVVNPDAIKNKVEDFIKKYENDKAEE